MKNEELNLKSLIAVIVADIDVYLLQNEEQTGDNDKESFTREEIRNQLSSTMSNVSNALLKLGYDIEEPLLRHDILHNLLDNVLDNA